MKRQPTDKLQTNVLGMLTAVIGFALVAIYGTLTLAAQDPTWFLTSFDERPTRMVVYRVGQRIELQAGQPGFDELAEAVRSSLAEGVSRPSGIGLSEGSLQDAYSLNLTLEVFFDRPVKLHAWFDTDRPTRMLFPITGRHSEMPIVFLGRSDKYMSNAPMLKTVEPIRSTLKSLGFVL
jgi:hypothetical protein